MKYLLLIILAMSFINSEGQNKRVRDYGIKIGVLKPGKYNAITDVPGVKVGHETIREGDSMFEESKVLRNEYLDILFEAVIEATEEAIINSLFAAETMVAGNNVRVEALPVEKTLEIMRKYQ